MMAIAEVREALWIADRALDERDAVATLRALAAAADAISCRLYTEVERAARQGASISTIANALERRRATYTYGLGELFPGGASATTVRRTYDSAFRRAKGETT